MIARILVLLVVGLFAAATAYLFVYPDADPVPRRWMRSSCSPAGSTGSTRASGSGGRALRPRHLRRTQPELAAGEQALRSAARALLRPEPVQHARRARWTAARDWGSVVVVTSTYHVRRTRELFERCVDGAAGRRRGRAAVRQLHRRRHLGVAEIRLVLGVFRAAASRGRPLHFGRDAARAEPGTRATSPLNVTTVRRAHVWCSKGPRRWSNGDRPLRSAAGGFQWPTRDPARAVRPGSPRVQRKISRRRALRGDGWRCVYMRDG